MRIKDIYEHYQVPPWLQVHQVRVAAVAKLVAEAQKEPVDLVRSVSTALVHDIGAIVKFDFLHQSHEELRSLCPPEESMYWIEVQRHVRDTYGVTEYDASEAIIRELGFEHVRQLLSEIGISHMRRMVATGNREAQVVQYGDMRVSPHGIVPIQERVQDVINRYQAYWKHEGEWERSREYPRDAHELEKVLFVGTSLRPEDINDDTVLSVMEELWEYEIT